MLPSYIDYSTNFPAKSIEFYIQITQSFQSLPGIQDVKSVNDTDHRTNVTFANSTPQREFYLFIAGDGLGSPTYSLNPPRLQKILHTPP